MALVRFDPFAGLRELDRWFDLPASSRRSEAIWAPRLDVFDREGALVVRAELPGVDPADVDVTLDGGVLTISGTRRFASETGESGMHRKEIFEGSFSRKVRLPEGIDPEAITATARDGILEVSVPKRPDVLARRVTVEVTGQAH